MSRIAIWLHGGIGGGFFSQGQPAIQQLVERLANHFEVEVYSANPPNRGFVSSGYRIHYLEMRAVPRALRWIFLLMRFVRNHRTKRYQVVYAFWGYPAGACAVMLGKVFNIPSLVHLQGGDAVSLPDLDYGVFRNPLRAMFCRWIYNHSSVLIALTAFQALCLRSNRVTKEPVVIPFGVDTDHFAFRVHRAPRGALRFLYVGNLTPVKGQEVMLNAFAQIVRRHPARLTVVGADFDGGRLMKLCASLEIQPFVEFLGPQPHVNMPRLYWEADFLLHTSWYEGQGLVIAEAAACGTLVAGTNVGMLADMGDDCAVIVGNGEADALAEQILRVVAAPVTFSKMQHNARRWVEEKDVNYTEQRIVETINALLHATVPKSEASTFQA